MNNLNFTTFFKSLVYLPAFIIYNAIKYAILLFSQQNATNDDLNLLAQISCKEFTDYLKWEKGGIKYIIYLSFWITVYYLILGDHLPILGWSLLIFIVTSLRTIEYFFPKAIS